MYFYPMISFLKRNIFITILFLITLSLGFLTFLTFIDKSFINLNEKNLQTLLILNIILIILFFIIIFREIKSSLKENLNVRGSIANKKYVIFFSLFTLIPSLLISVFSLFIFSFALNKYFDQKITTAVNNSYEIANKYVEEKRNKVFGKIAEKGKTSMGWFFGFKLHMIINDAGQIMAIKITKGNVDDRTLQS